MSLVEYIRGNGSLSTMIQSVLLVGVLLSVLVVGPAAAEPVSQLASTSQASVVPLTGVQEVDMSSVICDGDERQFEQILQNLLTIASVLALVAGTSVYALFRFARSASPDSDKYSESDGRKALISGVMVIVSLYLLEFGLDLLLNIDISCITPG